MGIYTNFSLNEGASSDYTSVEPFKGEHFNYHELGIIAAAESAANQNSFMKALALSELASVEQYGTTDVLYEGVNIKGIIDKVKAFFKKLIEKIHKIFHTFVAQLSAWFGNSADFAKKYEKEVIKNWSKVSNDWEFKGYKFDNICGDSETAKIYQQGNKEFYKDELNDIKTTPEAWNQVLDGLAIGNVSVNASDPDKLNDLNEVIKKLRDNMDDIKESMRGYYIKRLTGQGSSKMDASEFTNELFKAYRSGEDSKQDLKKSDILNCYGGSIGTMMTFLKDFNKIKSSLEKQEKDVVAGIDKIIKELDKSSDEMIKSNKSETDKNAVAKREATVGLISVCQSLLGFEKEITIQMLSAEMQATKDACAQAKEIAVKVIGLSKKMTEESADLTSGYDGNGFGFIESVQLV